jgi:hypothetical protein
MAKHGTQWKMSLLLGMVLCVVVVILEGGARLIIHYEFESPVKRRLPRKRPSKSRI